MIVSLAPTVRLALFSSADRTAANSRVAPIAYVATRAIDPDDGSRYHVVADEHPAGGVVV